MIYKFKSKAAGDVIMLGPNGDQMLRLLGREPAAKGIIEVADMAAAIAALQEAAAQAEARQPTARRRPRRRPQAARLADGRDAQALAWPPAADRLGRLTESAT